MMQRFSRFGIFMALSLFAVLGTQPASAQNAAGADASQIIRFSASEELHQDNAANILAKKLEINATTDELRSAYIENPGDGLQVQRFNQYFKGLRVTHGSFSMTSKNGVPSYAFGKFYKIDPATSINPSLAEHDALSKAIAMTGATHYEWENNPTLAPKGELQLVEDFRNGAPDGKVYLAYAFDIYASEPMSRNMVYIDAHSGDVLFKDAIIKNFTAKAASLYSDTVTFEVSRTGSLYYLHDTTRGSGVYTYNIHTATTPPSPITSAEVTNSTLLFPKDATIDAHWAAEKTYDYWKTVRSRNGWNGINGSQISYVHYGSAVINAFWNGNAMNFGDGGSGYGALVSVDVCAHELGHGVCQATANLTYSQESGGMNEGFSDIWGNVVEQWSDPHENDAKAKDTWLVGEELGTPLRSMRNPKQYGQPDTYQGTNWVYAGTGCNTSNDNCGVHTNSGILNYWFYLLSVGGKGRNDNGTAYKVEPIGMNKAATIVYATELALNSTANYYSCRTASIAAATTLYGACSPEVEAVTRAWYAVGVGGGYSSSCVPQISFSDFETTVDENAGVTNACPATHTANVPVQLQGAALAGGNAIVTATVIGGNAVAGVDYDAPTLTTTFTVSGGTTQYLPITIYDNAFTGAAKYIDLAYTLNSGSSNAIKSSIFDTVRVFISSDDVAPDAGGSEDHQALTFDALGNTSSPFYSSALASHSQYIYRASELRAAGLRPGVPVTSADFFITAKYSTMPYSGFTMKIAHTSAMSLGSGFLAGSFTSVYSGNLTTASGTNTLTFSTPFIWNGTDNIVVECCYTNTSKVASNDRVECQSGSPYLAGVVYSNSTSTSGCALTLTGPYLASSRPIINFTQAVPPTRIANLTTDTRTWKVTAGTTNYFYTADSSKLIATIAAPTDTLSCLTAKVDVAGKGFVPATSGGANRSMKEWGIRSGAVLKDSISFDATLYITTAELGNIDPASVLMVRTTSANDMLMNASNTEIVTPSSTFNGQDYIGFTGTFHKTGRFFLTDRRIALSTGTAAAANDGLWTGANPFTDAPVLHWSLAAPEHAIIRVYDVTGKTIWSAEQTLSAGAHSLQLADGANFAPGTYVVQVVRAGGVFTRKMIRE